jgi:hypothetical protein
MLIKSISKALDHTKNASIAMSSAVVGRAAPPYITTPDLPDYSHLRNIQVHMSLNMGIQPIPMAPARKAYFVDAVADTQVLLSLHLTFVTICVELKFGVFARYRKSLSRATVMREGQDAFRKFQNGGEIKAKHVIFDFTNKDGTEPFETPYIAFVRHTVRSTKVHDRQIALKRARYVLYGHDLQYLPDEEAIEGDEKVTKYLEEIIRLSRKSC